MNGELADSGTALDIRSGRNDNPGQGIQTMFGFLKKKSEEVPPEAPPEAVANPSLEGSRDATPVVEADARAEVTVAEPVAESSAAPSAQGGFEIVVPPRREPSSILAEFEQEIERQEDRLYGVALFFECLSLLHAGQGGVLDTNRKQFRNIIVSGHTSIGQARALVEKAKQDPAAIDAVRAFRFTFCEGHPNPVGLAARADALLKAYRNLFPERPLDKPFTEDETYRLIASASNVVSPVMEEH